MKKIIFAASFAALATGATAQASNFEGASGALNLNSVSSTIKFIDSAVDGSTFDGVGKQAWNGSIQAAYGFVTSPSTVVSVGASYGLGKSKAGELIGSDGTLAFKVKDQLSVYVEPGYLVSNSTLLYGKLSYERAKAVASFTGVPDFSKSVNGSGFGFGVRTMLDKTSFIQVEVRQVAYRTITNDETSIKPKATIGTIGVGMKF